MGSEPPAAKLYRERIRPDVPVLVQVEGDKPTVDQIDQCRRLWTELYEAMDFRMTSFPPDPSTYCREIMAPAIVEIPA